MAEHEMKCIICKTEHGLNVFSTVSIIAAADVGYLYGICYYCYIKVPKYIPKRQAKRWLLHEMQNL